MQYKCLVIDDEPLARELVASYVNQVETLQLIDCCKDAIDAFNHPSFQDIDLIFLDIEMPEISGFEFIENMKPSAAIILTTAYREYAVKSYEMDILDYLVKPISFTRFLKSINKFLRYREVAPIHPVENTESNIEEEQFLFVKADRKMVKVYFNEIFYIEGLKDYSRIHLIDRKITTAKNLLYFENRLPEKLFSRIHKSHIIGLKKISSYSKNMVELEEISLPIGRTYKKKFQEAIKTNLVEAHD